MVFVGGAFGRFLNHEGRTLINGGSREILNSFNYVKTQNAANQKMTLSPLCCWHPSFRLPASRMMSNKFLLFMSCPVCGILWLQPEWTNLQDCFKTSLILTLSWEKSLNLKWTWWCIYSKVQILWLWKFIPTTLLLDYYIWFKWFLFFTFLLFPHHKRKTFIFLVWYYMRDG